MSYNHNMNSPFILENETEYKDWRHHKLSLFPANKEDLIIKLNNKDINSNKIELIKNIISKYNFAIYEFESKITNETLKEFCSKLNLVKSISNPLSDENNISNITNEPKLVEKKSGVEYIPYTNKQLNWHTDGYYYPIDKSVKSFLLHCECPADEGGKNLLIDHEIIYIYLRDHNPDYIDILMKKNIMEIPKNKNIKGSKSIIGPVFYIDDEGLLNMRFTSREQNIIWKRNDIIKKIKEYIYSFISENSKYTFDLLLKENQGYIANNILHKREKYIDRQNKRLVKRIRFSKRIK